MRNVRGRALGVAAALLLAVLYILPTFVNLPAWWADIFPTSRIRLGLDLQGGLYLTLEVKVDEAVETYVDQAIQTAKRGLARAGIEGARVAREGSNTLRVVLPEGADGETARRALGEVLPGTFGPITPAPGGGAALVSQIRPDELAKLREGAVEQALATLRSRIDQYGVTEPTVQRQGEARIVLQLPGVRHPEEVQRLIATTARLEFKEIDDRSELMKPLLANLPRGIALKNDEIKLSDKEKKPLTSPYLVAAKPGVLRKYVHGKLPGTHEILLGEEPGQGTEQAAFRTYLVKAPTLMTGEGVVNARVRFAPTTGVPVVVFEFDEESAVRFADTTERLKDKRMAIIVDGSVKSAPVIGQRIAGGRAQIAGLMSDREARDLAIMLRTGALRASVAKVAQRSVGPNLGRDSVRSGLVATLVGLMTVMAFMAVYYRASGLFANLAVLLNMAFVLAALAAFDATLTLPGIAGIALTVGMAVDANVLVFERIREEIRIGKTFRAAVDAGFDRAFRTIVDANATTLIAALILYYYGVGPVRGFAVTLSLGIVGTIFTSLVFTRLLFSLAIGSRGNREVSI